MGLRWLWSILLGVVILFSFVKPVEADKIKKRKSEIRKQKTTDMLPKKGFNNPTETSHLHVVLQSLLSIESLQQLFNGASLGSLTLLLKQILYDENAVEEDTRLLIRALDGAEDELNCPFKLLKYLIREVLGKETPDIEVFFRGQRERLKLYECGHSTQTGVVKPFWTISLKNMEFQENSVTNACNTYLSDFRGQILEKEEAKGLTKLEEECPECKAISRFHKGWRIVAAPRLLVLEVREAKQLDLQIIEEFSKEKQVRFEEQMHTTLGGSDLLHYQLKSVIENVGKDTHFVAYAKRRLGDSLIWVRADEGIVEKKEGEEVVAIKFPSFLVYERISCGD